MRLAIRPFGVLGTRLTAIGAVKKVGQAPVPGFPIVDPSGLPFIRNGPRGAGGASGEIYRWLGIADEESFPTPVREAIAVDCEVVLVAPSMGLPTTSSGKLSRSRAKANYLAGLYASLGARDSSRASLPTDGEGRATGVARPQLRLRLCLQVLAPERAA